MPYKIDPVEAVGAYSSYFRHTRYLDYAAYVLDPRSSPVQLAQQADWLAAYRKGLYPIGSTPLGLPRGAQSPEAVQFGNWPPRVVRLDFRHHPVFTNLPRYHPPGEETWKSLFSAPREQASPARAATTARPAFSLPAFFARTAKQRPDTQAFLAPDALAG